MVDEIDAAATSTAGIVVVVDSERTLADTYKSLVEDEKFADVAFQCSDGMTVFAIRAVLGARSSFFEAQLYGQWKESSGRKFRDEKLVVPTNYGSAVMRSVVSYCATGHTRIKCREIQPTLELIEAANYYQLPALNKAVVEAIQTVLLKHHDLVVPFYEACKVVGSLDDLQAFAWRRIIDDTKHTVVPTICARSLSFDTLRHVLRQEILFVSEEELFDTVYAWSGVEEGGDDEFEGSSQEKASQLIAKYFDLSLISPTKLAKTVEPSGLVFETAMSKIYKRIALRAADSMKDSWKMKRNQRVWLGLDSPLATSRTDPPDTQPGGFLLSMNDPMSSGLWSWDLKIEELTPCTSVGVMAFDESIWLYCNNGEVAVKRHDEQRYTYSKNVHQTFEKGSVVTLTIDLDGDGTLFASVNGQEFALFAGMRKYTAFGKNNSFLPYVQQNQPGRILFLGFRSMPEYESDNEDEDGEAAEHDVEGGDNQSPTDGNNTDEEKHNERIRGVINQS